MSQATNFSMDLARRTLVQRAAKAFDLETAARTLEDLAPQARRLAEGFALKQADAEDALRAQQVLAAANALEFAQAQADTHLTHTAQQMLARAIDPPDYGAMTLRALQALPPELGGMVAHEREAAPERPRQS